MKNFKLKLGLVLMGVVFYCSSVFAQSTPVTVTNTTGCPVFIEYAEATDCLGNICYSAPSPNCVAPGATISIAPCAGPGFKWGSIGITSADFSCSPCGFLQTVNSSYICYGGPYSIALPMCGGCGPVKVTWVAPDHVVIL